MKKSTFSFIISIILLSLILNLFLISIKAEDSSIPPMPGIPGTGNINPDTGLPVEIEKIQAIGNNLTKEQISSNYLKKEWKQMLLDNKYTAPIVIVIDSTFTFLNPFFKSVLGIEYSFSWAFIFALTIWIVLFFFLFQPSKAIFNDNALFALIASFAITSLVGLSGVIKRAVDLLSIMITNTWIFWSSIIITVIIGFLIIKSGGGLKKIIEKEKEKSEKEKTEKAQKTIQTHGKISKKELEDYKE